MYNSGVLICVLCTVSVCVCVRQREQNRKLLFYFVNFFFLLSVAYGCEYVTSICWFGGGSGTVVVFFSFVVLFYTSLGILLHFFSLSRSFARFVVKYRVYYLLVVSLSIRDLHFTHLCVCPFLKDSPQSHVHIHSFASVHSLIQ